MSASVLIVDDDGVGNIVLAALLEDAAFQVDIAPSFAAAREKLRMSGASYDIVLLDQNLGDGCGTDLLPLMRAHLPNAKAVLLSGAAMEDSVAPGSAEATVAKGVDFLVLLAELQRLLGLARHS